MPQCSSCPKVFEGLRSHRKRFNGRVEIASVSEIHKAKVASIERLLHRNPRLNQAMGNRPIIGCISIVRSECRNGHETDPDIPQSRMGQKGSSSALHVPNACSQTQHDLHQGFAQRTMPASFRMHFLHEASKQRPCVPTLAQDAVPFMRRRTVRPAAPAEAAGRGRRLLQDNRTAQW